MQSRSVHGLNQYFSECEHQVKYFGKTQVHSQKAHEPWTYSCIKCDYQEKKLFMNMVTQIQCMDKECFCELWSSGINLIFEMNFVKNKWKLRRPWSVLIVNTKTILGLTYCNILVVIMKGYGKLLSVWFQNKYGVMYKVIFNGDINCLNINVPNVL